MFEEITMYCAVLR